jgi:hypothetical protein
MQPGTKSEHREVLNTFGEGQMCIQRREARVLSWRWPSDRPIIDSGLTESVSPPGETLSLLRQLNCKGRHLSYRMFAVSQAG